MKNKNLVITLTGFVFVLLMCFSTVSATIAYVTPTASQYLPSGTFMVNVTYAAADISGVTNFSDGNSSIFFNNVMFTTYTGNRGCDATNCWALINSADTGISEGTYTLKVSLGNETQKWYVNGSETVTIDRTNPSLSIKETTVFKGRPINYKCSDTNIDAVTVTDGTTTTTLQKSTSDYVQFVPTLAGTYTFNCTDLAGNSASNTVIASNADGFAGKSQAGSNPSSSNNLIWIIVIGLIALYLVGKKK